MKKKHIFVSYSLPKWKELSHMWCSSQKSVSQNENGGGLSDKNFMSVFRLKFILCRGVRGSFQNHPEKEMNVKRPSNKKLLKFSLKGVSFSPSFCVTVIVEGTFLRPNKVESYQYPFYNF